MEPAFITIIALLSGGAIWEGFKFAYPEIKRSIDSHRDARNSFYENLDPILKSASELYGKLESLSKEDFSTFVNPLNSNSNDVDQNKKYVYYLFGQFWGQLENLRLENHYTSLSRIKKGSELIRFIETFESRTFRILDRSQQRIIGECLITQKDQKFKILTLNEFLIQFENPHSNLYKRVKVLEDLLSMMSDKKRRQIILVFGVIVAALIDHFDPKYKTVRRRKIYRNKLSEKSKKVIEYHLVGHYIPFIKDKRRYY